MTEHSLIGASSIGRIMACPGSFELSQQITTPSRSSVWAAQGTVAHKLAEEALTEGYDPVRELGTVVTMDGHEITVDQEMVDAVQVYLDEIKRRSADNPGRFFEARVCLDSLWADDERPVVSAFGTADAVLLHYDAKHVDVIDLKYGSGVHVPADSPQLFYYAAGALTPWAETIDLTIVQPRGKGAAVRTHHTTALDVLIWVEEVLKPAVAAAMAPNAPLTTGKHCRFCPAQAQCPALHKMAQDLARKDFGPSPDRLYFLPEEELLRSVGGLLLGDMLYERKLCTPAQTEKICAPSEWDLVKDFVESRSSGFKLVQAADLSRPSAAQDFDECVA